MSSVTFMFDADLLKYLFVLFYFFFLVNVRKQPKTFFLNHTLYLQASLYTSFNSGNIFLNFTILSTCLIWGMIYFYIRTNNFPLLRRRKLVKLVNYSFHKLFKDCTAHRFRYCGAMYIYNAQTRFIWRCVSVMAQLNIDRFSLYSRQICSVSGVTWSIQ